MQSSSALSRTCCARCTWPNNSTSISRLLSCIGSSAISVLEMHGCVRPAPGFHMSADCPICGDIGQGVANALAANGIEAAGAGGPGVQLGGCGPDISPGCWSQRMSGSVSAGVSKAAIMICLGGLQRDGAAVNDADRVDEISE